MFFKNLKRNLNRNYFINETNLSRKLTSEQYSLLIAPIRLIKVLCFLTIINPLLTGLDFANQAAKGNLIFFLTWFIIFLIISSAHIINCYQKKIFKKPYYLIFNIGPYYILIVLVIIFALIYSKPIANQHSYTSNISPISFFVFIFLFMICVFYDNYFFAGNIYKYVVPKWKNQVDLWFLNDKDAIYMDRKLYLKEVMNISSSSNDDFTRLN